MVPKGKLVIIGGAVDTGSGIDSTQKAANQDVHVRFFEKGILRRLINESAKKSQSRVEIITTASKIPELVGDEYLNAFAHLATNDVGIMHINRREQANSEEMVERIKACDIVMITGGDQLRLSTILGGTEMHHALLLKYMEQDFIISGTSAGAAAASTTMIYQGSHTEALLKGEIKITGGLGFINNVIIDTHFVHRGRIGRLFQAVVSNPRMLGIGLGEDTGLLITHGSQMEAIGSGLVILVDGRKVKDTNITEVEMGEAISIEHLVVHVMAMHTRYNLDTHEMLVHKPIIKEEE